MLGRWLDISLATAPLKNRIPEDLYGDKIPRTQPFATEPTEGIILMMRGLPFALSEEEVTGQFVVYPLCSR